MRQSASDWTLDLYNRALPGMPQAHDFFQERCRAVCPAGGAVVDLGCGEADYMEFLSDKAGELIGVDIRPVRGSYDQYLQADFNEGIPVESESVDLAASKFLLEHLDRVDEFMGEVHRILRPGGTVLILTPNILYYPYFVNFLLSRVLKQKTRMKIIERLTGRKPDDIFPVFYGCNTPGKLRTAMREAGFRITALNSYCACLVSAFNRVLGAIAVGYEWVCEAMNLNSAQGLIVVEAVKL